MAHDARNHRTLVFPGSLDEFSDCLRHTLIYNRAILLDYEGYTYPDETTWRLECGDTVLVVNQQDTPSSHTCRWWIHLEEEVNRYLENVDPEGYPNPESVLDLEHAALVHVRQRGDDCVVTFVDGRTDVHPYDEYNSKPIGWTFESFVETVKEGIKAWKSDAPFIGTYYAEEPEYEVEQLQGQASFGTKRRNRANLFKELKLRHPKLTQVALAMEAQDVAEKRIQDQVENEYRSQSPVYVGKLAKQRFDETYGDLKWNETAVQNDWKEMREAGEVTDYKEYGTSRE